MTAVAELVVLFATVIFSSAPVEEAETSNLWVTGVVVVAMAVLSVFFDADFDFGQRSYFVEVIAHFSVSLLWSTVAYGRTKTVLHWR